MRRMYSKPQLLEAVEEESKLNGIKVFEDIKDKNGNPRFIEGDITMPTITGVTQKYGRWSLSGSHLLIVIAFDVADTTQILGNEVIAYVDIPEWVFNKIVPLWDSSVVDSGSFLLNANDWSTQAMTIGLSKMATNLRIRNESTITLTAERYIRVDFDLLIDNE